MDHLAQFLEQKDDGLIDMSSLRLVLLGQYKAQLEEAQPETGPEWAETDLTDILLPLKTEVAERRMQPADLCDIYDKDKNYLLSVDVFVDVLEKFTGYRVNANEQQLVLQTIKKVSGTTGMRTELKREEIAKMFELVEEKRPATEE